MPLIKDFRKEIDALIQKVPHGFHGSMRAGFYGEGSHQFSESYAEVRINLTNAKMWAGKMLEALGNPFPPELVDKTIVP